MLELYRKIVTLETLEKELDDTKNPLRRLLRDLKQGVKGEATHPRKSG